jgi:hypothetical protein
VPGRGGRRAGAGGPAGSPRSRRCAVVVDMVLNDDLDVQTRLGAAASDRLVNRNVLSRRKLRQRQRGKRSSDPPDWINIRNWHPRRELRTITSLGVGVAEDIHAYLAANLWEGGGSVGSALDGGTGPAMSLEQQIDRLQAQRLQSPFLLKG